MPNMSRPALRPSGATPPAALAVRRSLDSRDQALELEQSWTYRCAHDQQSASISTMNSNYLLNNSSAVTSSATVRSSSTITWIFSTIWTMITTTLSTISSVFTRTHLFSFESSASDAYNKQGSNSLLSKLQLWYYKSACYVILLDLWILSLFHRSENNSAGASAHEALARRRRMYLLFLLLPLLLAALLSCCGSSVPSAIVASYTTWVSALPSLWQSAMTALLPVWGGGNGSWSWNWSALWNSNKVVQRSVVESMPQPQLDELQFLPHGDLDALVQRLLASAEFRNLVAQRPETVSEAGSDVEAESERSLHLLAAIEAEQLRLKEELLQKGDLASEHEKRLLEHQHSHDRLVLENSIMKSHIEELEGQMKMLQARLVTSGSGGGSFAAGRCCRVPVRVGSEGGAASVGDSDARRVLLAVEAALAGKITSGRVDGNEKEITTEEEEALLQRLRVLASAHDDLEARLALLAKNLTEALHKASKVSEETIMATISSRVQEEFSKKGAAMGTSGEGAGSFGAFVGKDVTAGSGCCNCTLGIDQIKKIVNDAISLYDADKTGLVDYALESGGGTVINIRCTENYNDRSLALAFLGMTLPWSNNHPRIALQPGVHPGECWAFRGAQGWLVVRLSRRIRVGAVSIEHIPASISSAGNIDAAPKDFSILGLENESDADPVLLGKFSYSNTGPSLQFFPVQNENAPPYQIVELAIESNHGNLEYTCLYRFRVHGTPA